MELKAQNDSLREANKALVAEVESIRNKSKATSKRHELDLWTLRRGIDLLHRGLQKRSGESVELLSKVDSSLERIEDKAFSSHADEESEEGKEMVAFRQLIPQVRQDLLELREKLDMEKQQQFGAQSQSPSAEASPKGEGRERVSNGLSPSPSRKSPTATEMLLGEYRNALAKANGEIESLRGQLGSCLNEKSNLRQELEEKVEDLELREEEESSQVASAHASEALALKSMHLLESRISELRAVKESSEKQVAILKSQLVDMEGKLLSSKDHVGQLCQDNESLSAFGVKQQNEIDELKHLVSVQKKDIRAALGVIKSCQWLPPPQDFSGNEPEERDEEHEQGDLDAFMMMEQAEQEEQEESSSVMDEFEQEISHLDQELQRLEKSIS